MTTQRLPVLILGATSDIGFALARRFAAAGHAIQLAAREPQRLEAFASDLRVRYRISCSLHAFDAAAYDTHTAFYGSLPQKPGIAMYVIGYMKENEMVAGSWEETSRTITANYSGAVSVINIIAQDFSASGAGTIVGISSVAGNRGRGSNYIYGSAKAGFTAYLSGLRNRLASRGVHVMTVLPGFVHTKMTEHLDLPPLLTAEPAQVAEAVWKGVAQKKNVIYVKWFWRYIMTLIGLVPEGMFKKMKL